MIIVPIAIAWFQIHVSSGHTNGIQRIFDPIREVPVTIDFQIEYIKINVQHI